MVVCKHSQKTLFYGHGAVYILISVCKGEMSIVKKSNPIMNIRFSVMYQPLNLCIEEMKKDTVRQ